MVGDHYPVVIVGSGPTGLSLAIELGLRGVRCLVIERNPRVGLAPRAKTTNVRTRTHLRRWGIADKLAAASPFGVDYPSNVMFVTNLSGVRLAQIDNASNCAPAQNPLYPEHGQWIPQYKLEQVLREHADTLGAVSIRFNTQFLDAIQTDAAVELTARDRTDGETLTITCDYLVGADGARSQVREVIGATMSGEPELARHCNIIFRAPGLAEAHGHGPAIMYWQTHPAAPSLISPMDANDKWVFTPTRVPADFHVSDAEAAGLIRRATGIDLPYKILGQDAWVAASLIADRYRDRRIFLAGDACHLHPPFGGFGMNMGVSDGVDLGWKLAAVVGGSGGPALLDSYVIERRPVHQQVIAEAKANHAVLSNELWDEGVENPGADGEALRLRMRDHIVAAKSREFHTLGIVLGSFYEASPIIEADTIDAPEPPVAAQGYAPSSRPGCLAPHLWRPDGRSLYDLFENRFAMIVRGAAEPMQIKQACDEARSLGISLSIVTLTADEAADLYPARLTLVRPDQHVARRGDTWRRGALRQALGWQNETNKPVAEHAAAASD